MDAVHPMVSLEDVAAIISKRPVCLCDNWQSTAGSIECRRPIRNCANPFATQHRSRLLSIHENKKIMGHWLMKHPAMIYASAALLNTFFIWISKSNLPYMAIDDNTIALVSAVTALLTVLGTIVALLNQLRTGSVKDLQKLVELLNKKIGSIEHENALLRKENNELRKDLNSLTQSMTEHKNRKRPA